LCLPQRSSFEGLTESSSKEKHGKMKPEGINKSKTKAKKEGMSTEHSIYT